MLAVVPIRDGVLPAGGAEAVSECAGRALLIGSGTDDAVLLLTGVATDVVLVEAGVFRPAAWAAALVPLLTDAPHVVLPASPDGRDLGPRLAAALQRDLYAGAISITADHIELARHGGLAITDVRPAASFVATLQSGVRGVDVVGSPEPNTAHAGPSITEISIEIDDAADAGVRLVETLAPDAATMDLAESARIVAGGAGLTSPDAFAELSAVAAAIDASMGATRVVTDRGWVGHERQIGTTGVVVAPRLYLAFGISGAVQHTSGLGQPEHVISVNIDPHCPMMQLADVAIVSDANEVLGELLLRLTPPQRLAADA